MTPGKITQRALHVRSALLGNHHSPADPLLKAAVTLADTLSRTVTGLTR